MATTTERRSTVVGVFEDPRQAETAVRELCESGLREDQIRVEEARYFHGDAVTNRISVTIEANGRSEEDETILRRHGAVDVHTDAASGATPAPSGAPAAAAPAAPAPRTGEAAERIQLRDAQAAPEKSLGVMGKADEEARILHRAYLKWLGEGCPEGQDRRHYFEAAREVRG